MYECWCVGKEIEQWICRGCGFVFVLVGLMFGKVVCLGVYEFVVIIGNFV